ncbi:hypothetical protein SAMD00019534_073590, partial [Acytostelium subglobosum LB1]|uniref:hypothetical protein n=1 Tax=Acytostelium subglobosum LB1 TaxID=1410327 RepID=UPI000644F52B
MENVVSKELDYTPLLVAEPEYEYTRLFPQSGTTSTTVYSGGNDTIFEIPPSKAYNLSRSYFRFIFNLPGVANKQTMMFADFCPFFRQIQVYIGGGLDLMNHTAAFNVTNMAIYLAVEKNLAIVNELQTKIFSPDGFSLMIPYSYSYQAALTGQNQSVTLRVNRQNGMTLERIYHSLFLTQTAANTAIYNNNWRNTKLDHFYTNINNNRLMQYDYYLNLNDDYMALRWILKDSSLLTPRIHNRNWCWIEEFGDGTSNFNKDNAITGIDLNLGEQKWDFIGFLSENTNLTHQSTVVCKRKLVITPNGLVLV